MAPQTDIDQSTGLPSGITGSDAALSLRDRIGSTLGRTISAASGGDPSQPSALEMAINKHHQQQMEDAKMHRDNLANYYSSPLMVRQGINPETGQRFDDPNYQGGAAQSKIDQQNLDAKYTQRYLSSLQAYGKAVGMNKDLKDAIQKQSDLM